MTINTSSNKTIVLGDGSQTQFAFGFVGVAAAYISVIYTDADGNETVLNQGSGSSQYRIALNAPVQGALWGLGGTVTYNPSGSPIANGTSLTIFRTLPLTQAISLQNLISLSTLGNGAETGLDTLEMQLQQVKETFGRAIVAPIVDPDTINLTLPAAAQRANLALLFDGQGNVIAGSVPGSGTISSAMQPVVNAASLAAGRTAFGLGSTATENIGAGLQDNGSGSLEVNAPLNSVSTNQSVTSSFAQKVYVVTGPVNFTLAELSTLWNGFAFEVFVLGGALSLVPNAADSVQGQTSGATVAIPANSWARIEGDGASSGNWRIAWMPWNVDGANKALIGPVAFGAVRGLTIQNDSGTPNTKIDVAAADLVMVNSSGYGVKASGVSFVIDLTTGTATSTPNGLDGEGIPANGWIYLWAIGNGATTAGLASTSSTAPTLPTGYTFKKYLGAMRTASSVLRSTKQFGNRSVYTSLQTFVTGTSTGFNAASVASVVPPTAIAIVMSASGIYTSGEQYQVAPNSGYSSPGLSGFTNQTASTIDLTAQVEMLLESSNIYWGSTSLLTLQAYGWTDGNV